MPVKSLDQVAELVTAKCIAGFLVDTCIYEAKNFSFGNGVVKQLLNLKGHDLTLLITDVIYHEVVSHFELKMTDQKKGFEKAIGILGGGWGVSKQTENEVIEKLFGTESVRDYCKKTLDNFIDAAQAEKIQCHEMTDVQDVLNLYHNRKAPFSDRKKHEFPDALTLLAIDKWAYHNDKQVVVISNDGDVEEFCKTSEWLIHIKDLSEAISTLHSDKSVVGIIAQKVKSGEFDIYGDFDDQLSLVWDKIEVKESAHSWVDFEVEVTDLSISDVHADFQDILEDASLIEHTSINIKLELKVPCTLRADFDVSFSKWDKEDGQYFGIGSCEYSREADAELLVIAEFFIESGEIAFGDFELQRSSARFNLGDIGPWDDEALTEPDEEEA